MQSGNRTQIYNGISIFFLVLTVLAVVLIVVALLGPEQTETVGSLPTQYIPPTPTNTLTPTITLTPTRTLIPTFTATFTDTPTPTFTLTLSPTITPSPTITYTPSITFTPSDTPTASISPTFTPTVTPTGPTPTFTPTLSPYFFTLREQIIFSPNTVNTLGCAWQGIGGNVLGLDGQEVTSVYRIHAFGGGFDNAANTGSNLLYGQRSGWEIFVDTRPAPRTFYIRIETTLGVPLSEDFLLQFPGDCNTNLATVRFVQTRQLGSP